MVSAILQKNVPVTKFKYVGLWKISLNIDNSFVYFRLYLRITLRIMQGFQLKIELNVKTQRRLLEVSSEVDSNCIHIGAVEGSLGGKPYY